MTDFIVALTPLTLSPVIVFVLITVLNVIGNVLKALTFSNSTMSIASVWISLWNSYACSTSGACILYHSTELSSVLSSTANSCGSFLAQYRATEALAILSSIASGILVVVSLGLIVYERTLSFRSVSRIGLLSSVALMGLELVTFVLFVTLSGRVCITAIATPSLQPAPFMYLGGMVFAMINCGVYIRIGQVYKEPHVGVRSPSAPRFLPAVPSQSVHMSPRAPSAIHQPSVVTLEPASAPPSVNRSILAETRQPISPIRVRSPQRVRSPVSTTEGLWPDGDDWQLDEPSGLLWSEAKHLFFDRSSGQFYDPRSDQWYDPEADRWYKLTK